MHTTGHPFPWLELMGHPAFCVKDGVVVAANKAAEHHMICVGTDIHEIVTEHADAYKTFQNGCLYLTITAGDLPCNASITRTKEYDIFLIHQDADDDHLQTLALAAQQLRIPLSNVMAVTDFLLRDLDDSDPEIQQKTSQINRNLFQLLRIVSNMSDAGSYKHLASSGMQTVNLTTIVDELIEKAQTISANTGIKLSYTGPSTPILGLAYGEKLERAIYNLLSNALKFSPSGSTINIKLTKTEDTASFTICNTNTEPADANSFWYRYRRTPAIEDSRLGLGLGMTLISAVAAAHNGTVLVDHPTPSETRVTMTIAISKDNSGAVRSPVMRIGDYAGGRDKGLLELSEVLPTDAYLKVN